MTLDEIIKMLKADDYVELTPEENKEIVEYLEYYKEQDSVIKMYKAVYCDKQRKVNELEKELEVYKKALEELKENNNLLLKAYRLMAKDYCEDMGCAFCNHRAKCLEANHFEDLEGKDYLQLLFFKKAREEE